MEKAKVTTLLSNDGSNLTGDTIETPPWRESGRGMVVATLIGTGVIGSSIAVQGSHDATNWELIGTLALADTDNVKSQAIDYPWPFMRAVSSGKTGTVTALKVTLAQ